MNRCPRPFFRTLAPLLLGLGCALSGAAANAQDLSVPQTQNEAANGGRNFPIGTLRGTLVVVNAPEILLDGQPARLSPGARIHSAQNMLAMPASITGQNLLVNYTAEAGGMVREVWILTPAEAQAKRAAVDRPLFNFWPFAANTGPRDDGKTPFNQLPKYGE